MNYFERPEISNSDLTSLKKFYQSAQQVGDIEAAYRFGSLLDAVITEPHRVNFFNHTVDGIQYKAEEFAKAEAMKRAFLSDQFCRHVLQHSQTQKVSIRHDFPITFGGHTFTLPVRCKWDFFAKENVVTFPIDGDLKSTAAPTEKAFIESLDYFDYDRQAAWYMDIENRDRFIFIGVSKKNFKVFKHAIKRGDAMYQRGLAKYQELAFRWWYMFGDLSTYKNEKGEGETIDPKEVFEEAF